jgi:hypothetical protein
VNLSIGRTVLYTLNEDDAKAITKRRTDFVEHRNSDGYADTGYVAHVGNQVRAGDVFPAVVIRVWGTPEGPNNSANLKVLLDGTDDFWALSVSEGEQGEQRKWSWPPRV